MIPSSAGTSRARSTVTVHRGAGRSRRDRRSRNRTWRGSCSSRAVVTGWGLLAGNRLTYFIELSNLHMLFANRLYTFEYGVRKKVRSRKRDVSGEHLDASGADRDRRAGAVRALGAGRAAGVAQPGRGHRGRPRGGRTRG